MAEFVKEKYIDDWQVLAPTGYKDFVGVGKTVKYNIWDLYTTQYKLSCADNHILIKVTENNEYLETKVVDLIVGDEILVMDDDGNIVSDMVMVIYETDNSEHMYDLLDVQDDLYITNNIVSHNSTTMICYALWVVLFKSHQNVAILANKRDLSMELLGRLQTAYENLPMWLQQGVIQWNKTHIELENGSQILASSTSATSVRGSTFNIVFCDEFAFVPNNIQEEFMTSVYPTISSSKESKLIITSCVVKGTYILTNKGYTRIESFIKDELEKKSYHIPPYELIGMYDNNKGTVMCNNGKAPVRKIYTNFTELECSRTHKLYACKQGNYGWYRSSELETDDFIAVRYNNQVFGNLDTLDSELFPVVTPEFAYFFGIFCGAGYITDDRFITLAIRVTNSGDLEGDTYDDAIKNIGMDYESDGVFYIIDSVELSRLLKTLKYTSPDKYTTYGNGLTNVPLQWSKENTINFLQGCFDSMALVNHKKKCNWYGDIYITNTNEDLLEQVHLLLLNVGVINSIKKGLYEPRRYLWHRNRKMRYSRRTLVKIPNCYTPEFFDIVNFKMPHKQSWNRYQTEIRKFRKPKDLVPFFIPFIKQHLPLELQKKYIKQHFAFGKNQHKFVHMNRHNALKKLPILQSYNNSVVNEFVELNVRPDILWTKIIRINDDHIEYLYDFSLDTVPNDSWCHSVIYNGFVGEQTPRGLNLFYRIYQEAVRGTNEYVPVEITWDMIPGRDAEFKRSTIANVGERVFEQEFESSDYSTIVRIIDLEGVERDIQLGELYNLLKEQNILEQEQNCIDIESEIVA